MPQQATSTNPALINKAKGMNDEVSALKLEEGYTAASINLTADGENYDRRSGRNLYWLDDGNPVLSLHNLTWDDGSSSYIGQFGSSFSDITPTYSYYFRDGARLILQAPGLQYWDVTPGFTTGFIFPTVVSTPSATPQAASITVTDLQTIGFQIDGASRQLLSDWNHDGWYLLPGEDNLGSTQYTSDIVFTRSSGFSLIIQDSALNSFKFSVSDIGELIATTI